MGRLTDGQIKIEVYLHPELTRVFESSDEELADQYGCDMAEKYGSAFKSRCRVILGCSFGEFVPYDGTSDCEG